MLSATPSWFRSDRIGRFYLPALLGGGLMSIKVARLKQTAIGLHFDYAKSPGDQLDLLALFTQGIGIVRFADYRYGIAGSNQLECDVLVRMNHDGTLTCAASGGVGSRQLRGALREHTRIRNDFSLGGRRPHRIRLKVRKYGPASKPEA